MGMLPTYCNSLGCSGAKYNALSSLSML
uniref:Uncharacterized protein n=1 Tax=Anguilla anguilla TaxID=7936 RepID=A0A0E9SAT2_ANGAN